MNKTMAYTTTVITSLVILIIFTLGALFFKKTEKTDKVGMVGFIYDGDESTPYAYNFISVESKLTEKYSDRIRIISKLNVTSENCEQAVNELVSNGCDIIFATSIGYSKTIKKMAMLHPEIEFCQATGMDANLPPICLNYHTFMGRIYEGRYVAGLVAGLKLQSMIYEGRLEPEDVKIGYVAAYPYAEVISGYTAFLMGVRSVCPQAVMKVRYTNSWSSYTLEKESAEKLIDEGCVIISQHSDTVGPAVACEGKYPEKVAYHVGYNQSMIDMAPATSLVSTRINWEPYIMDAVGAVLEGKNIESCQDARINDLDAGAGFDKGWVEMLEINSPVVAPGTAELVRKTIEDMKEGKIEVFKGDYTGRRMDGSGDVINLRDGYEENAYQSAPTFDYVLDDVIEIEPDTPADSED